MKASEFAQMILRKVEEEGDAEMYVVNRSYESTDAIAAERYDLRRMDRDNEECRSLDWEPKPKKGMVWILDVI